MVNSFFVEQRLDSCGPHLGGHAGTQPVVSAMAVSGFSGYQAEEGVNRPIADRRQGWRITLTSVYSQT
jgi:hypothetical protein